MRPAATFLRGRSCMSNRCRRWLERAALITKHRKGREQIVRGNAATVRTAAALLDGYEQLWIDRATQIAGLLADEEGETT
jgi:hypothetical protein